MGLLMDSIPLVFVTTLSGKDIPKNAGMPSLPKKPGALPKNIGSAPKLGETVTGHQTPAMARTCCDP